MIEIKVNTDELIDKLSDYGKRQVPFAMANALNRTGEDIALATRQRIYQRGFTIRSSKSAAFIAAAIPKPMGTNRATKQRLRVLAWVNDALGKSSRYAVLPQMEEGATHVGTMALGGGRIPPSVAVPFRATLGQGLIPRSMYPKALGLQERRAIAGGTYYSGRGKKSRRQGRGRGSLQGQQRTFIVERASGSPLVVQRTGRGDRATRVLFTLKRSVPIPARRFYFPTATATAQRQMPSNLAGFLDQALRTAR